MDDAIAKHRTISSNLEAAACLETLTVALTKVQVAYCARNAGYLGLVLNSQAMVPPLLIGTFDPDWVARYRLRSYIDIDPVAKLGRRSLDAVDWDGVERVSANARRYFQEADRFRIGRRGLTIPVFGPFGDGALFTVTADHSDVGDWRAFRQRHEGDFRLLAHAVHRRVVAILGAADKATGTSLTRQVRACLELLAEGNGVKEIAARLGLSVHTVRKHLDQAKAQLGCRNKAEAVAKAVSLGLIRNRAFLGPS